MRNKLAIKAAIVATADKQGNVTPANVVAAAQNPKNPLHTAANWYWNQDEKAAAIYRLGVARNLIREIEYVSQDSTGEVVETVAYLHRPGREQCYVPIERAARTKKLAREIMLEELGRCEAAITRAKRVAIVLGMEGDLDTELANLTQLKKKVTRKPKQWKHYSLGVLAQNE